MAPAVHLLTINNRRLVRSSWVFSMRILTTRSTYMGGASSLLALAVAGCTTPSPRDVEASQSEAVLVDMNEAAPTMAMNDVAPATKQMSSQRPNWLILPTVRERSRA